MKCTTRITVAELGLCFFWNSIFYVYCAVSNSRW
nr:MAG TPA: hypothetical protein [Caudoviricetes sp.]